MHGSDPEFQVPVSQVTLGLVARTVFYSVSSTSENSLKQKQVCPGEGCPGEGCVYFYLEALSAISPLM